ncbi:hypothetical protein Salat_2429300 [Sesamum alatum]|uniref:RNase H type-1 domain-containing protein n=1 Tax=Sesamum alatum TaxID=300844 RepID=A0AAE1XYV2_9LAMI|nr:hypothetical protein Salat_2429300 [Sesamum alatum]
MPLPRLHRIREIGAVWNRNTPPKVRSFCWKLCNYALPTMSKLERRNPEVDDVCPVCKAASEDLLHTFLLYPAARQAWALSDLPWMVISDWKNDVESWFRSVTKKLDSPKGDRALTLCRQLWLNRNRWLWKNGGSSPLEIVARTRWILSDFEEYSCSLNNSVAAPRVSIKINFDGATFADLNSAGVGVIARNSDGVCIGWRKRLVPIRASPEHIELLAAAEAVAFGKEMGWNRIIVEGDCLLAIFQAEGLRGRPVHFW